MGWVVECGSGVDWFGSVQFCKMVSKRGRQRHGGLPRVAAGVFIVCALLTIYGVINMRADVPVDELQQPREKRFKERFKLNVAYAITITKDGNYIDGAAVLKESVSMIPTKHNVDYVAIVHPEVQTTRPTLLKLGFKIREFQAPITSAEIEGKHLRETIDKSGCCGALELLKLQAYTLTEYDKIVLMDMDTIMLKDIDHLLEEDIEAQFTYDYAMDGRNTPAPPVQGGFFVLKPSKKTFLKLIDIVREGDFQPGTGWGGTGIGWCWGGQTVQGLVSYYYNLVSKGNGKALNHCTYNAMVSTKDCEATPLESVYGAHFTVCQKPWDCRVSNLKLCRELIKSWWDIRRHLEKRLNLPVSTTDGCRSRSREYTSIKIV
mmetsp:Transcript_20290/g.33187  ORF Transcript_20290/g.33187 Transcript_20290/m.33187 type:complete len:375 (+) Transcript_20290:30-1154(+)